mmetsp:Transcript_110554/g.237937  ORF Transcript_110554/g.237937 Transcript_110554/m.237937 type:complete len:228 (+) Transcript_110554:208-891(+)
MSLSEDLIKGLVSMKMMLPSTIQSKAIPLILASNDHLLAQSRNGSGKTISFLCGSVSKIEVKNDSLQVLIVAPNRELMNQIYSVALELVKFINGIKIAKMIDIKDKDNFNGAHLLVSTPGIAVKAFKKKVVSFEKLKVVIFDEADIMLGASDKDHCTIIAKETIHIKDIQVLAFTATVNKTLEDWFKKSFKTCNKILSTVEELSLDGVQHLVIKCDTKEKLQTLDLM